MRNFETPRVTYSLNYIQHFFILIFMIGLIGCQASPSSSIVRSISSVSSCERRVTMDPIVGGEVVNAGDSDENLVTQILVRRGMTVQVCTGSLISDRIVLTAAHCVDKVHVKDISALFLTGENCPLYYQRLQNSEVAKVVTHQEFDGSPKSFADVALIYLDKNAPRDQFRLSIVTEQDQQTNNEFLLLGYGITNERSRDSQILRRIKKPASEIHVAENPRLLLVDQTGSKGGYCRGDSGSPLIGEVWTKPVIFGIQSVNVGAELDNECHQMSVAMNLKFFSPWVRSEVEKLEKRHWYSWLTDEFDRIIR